MKNQKINYLLTILFLVFLPNFNSFATIEKIEKPIKKVEKATKMTLFERVMAQKMVAKVKRQLARKTDPDDEDRKPTIDEKKANLYGIIALVTSVVTIVLTFTVRFFLLLFLLAIAMGILAIVHANRAGKENPRVKNGKSMGICALILCGGMILIGMLFLGLIFSTL
jgi:Flp pilus assembly protein TadB